MAARLTEKHKRARGVEALQLIEKKLSEIIPYKRNPRKNESAVNAVAESIRQCDYVAPIVVDEDGVILAGHTRYKALKKLKKESAQVVVKSGLTEEQKRKYRLLDNKTGELAEWDFELLAEELDGLDFEGFDFGFSVEDDVENEPDETEISEREIGPYKYIHYLVTIDVNDYDKFTPKIEELEEMGATVAQTRNNT